MMRTLTINTKDVSYPVVVGSNIIDQLPYYLHQTGINTRQILIITDSNVGPLYLNKIVNILEGYKVITYTVPAGESAKSIIQMEAIIEFAIKEGLTRNSLIIALGGGVVGDLAGFVAAVYLRGIPFIQIPTTILAHDSSVGGKVAINHTLGKNLIGSFHHPQLVFFDTIFLRTLPEREVKAGLAEVVKHGLIADLQFANLLYENAKELLELNLDYLNEVIYKGIGIKAAIVSQDEREQGIRAILNYGHTLAHSIETNSHYEYLHGEAVAIGMVFASKLAMQMGLTDDITVKYTIEILRRFSLPVSISSEFNSAQLIDTMMRDKKFLNNNIRMILPTELGKVKIVEGINKELLFAVIEELKTN